MNFETMDWDAEAQRVQRAFGIEPSCEFVLLRENGGRWFTVRDREEGEIIYGSLICGPLFISVNYYQNYMSFCVGMANLDDEPPMTSLKLGYDGNDIFVYELSKNHPEYALLISRALFYLDLISPEVEAALQLSITAHQKLEWTLEYEARYEL